MLAEVCSTEKALSRAYMCTLEKNVYLVCREPTYIFLSRTTPSSCAAVLVPLALLELAPDHANVQPPPFSAVEGGVSGEIPTVGGDGTLPSADVSLPSASVDAPSVDVSGECRWLRELNAHTVTSRVENATHPLSWVW